MSICAIWPAWVTWPSELKTIWSLALPAASCVTTLTLAEPSAADQEMGVAKPGVGIRIALEEYPGYSNTYRYQPLPYGLFDSNGLTSEYVFQQRGKAEFEPTGCNTICGIGDATMP